MIMYLQVQVNGSASKIDETVLKIIWSVSKIASNNVNQSLTNWVSVQQAGWAEQEFPAIPMTLIGLQLTNRGYDRHSLSNSF